MSAIRIFTMGVYGQSEESFFEHLTNHGITQFIDIRLRRGMRGKKYSFVNSTYLQEKLKALGINYLHVKDLAPTQDIRDAQKREDKKEGVHKRTRHELSEGFKQRYKSQCLDHFNIHTFLQQFGTNDHIVLFCVEQLPSACHRSLVAQRITELFQIDIEHII